MAANSPLSFRRNIVVKAMVGLAVMLGLSLGLRSLQPSQSLVGTIKPAPPSVSMAPHWENGAPSTTNESDLRIEPIVEQRAHDTLITFTYAESPEARENLKFFVQVGLHKAADFVFIFNGDTDAVNFVPDWDNIKVVRRENTCFDIGAIGEVMRANDLWKKYRQYVSINASIRGPFVPYWSNACWTDLFLSKINNRVKFVGMTANCIPRPHVQSMIFATDKVGMEILLDPARAKINFSDSWGGPDDPVGLSACYRDHSKAVHSEIGLATLIQNAGYEVDVMMAAFRQADNLSSYCEGLTRTQKDDILYDNAYFGFNVHPYETIFFKTNRKIDPLAIEHITSWTLKSNITSMELCKPK